MELEIQSMRWDNFAAAAAAEEASENAGAIAEHVVRVRRSFPEIWLWTGWNTDATYVVKTQIINMRAWCASVFFVFCLFV